MPPPTASDAWLKGRRFGIVIDAGSSGSRLQIYSWRDARLVRAEEGPKVYNKLPEVVKGTENPDDWVHKVEPGISTFGENPNQIAQYLRPLLDHARDHIPPSLHHETPLFLLATAGMRLLPSSQQDAILEATCNFIRFHSHFKVEDSDLTGKCGSSIRIITGEEEGLFGWIAVNYLMDQFTKVDDDQTTYGFLDMGGASTQIAFEPSAEEREKTKGLTDVQLRLIGGEEIHHQVFVTTWLGYGTNQARERYVGRTISLFEEGRDQHDYIPDPCLPKDLVLSESSVYPGHEDAHSRREHKLIGTGSFERCLNQVAPLLNKDAPCPDFEKAASNFCSREWDDILRQHELLKSKGALGGDGEVVEGGQVIDVGKWGDEVEIPRLQMQCFKSAWLVNVLHDGIGMPRIVDPGGDIKEQTNEVKDKANEKGLGKPVMQSLDSIGDTSISWTLGKMVLEASREVPPLLSDAAPLSDIHVGEVPSRDGPGTVDVLPQEPVLDEYDTDFTFVEFLSYLACFVLLLAIIYRLRRYLSDFTHLLLKGSIRRDYYGDRSALEEGQYSNGERHSLTGSSFKTFSSSYSRFWFSLRSSASRILTVFRSRTKMIPSIAISASRLSQPAPSRASPTRSYSSPVLRSQNVLPEVHYSSSGLPTRSGTPPAYRLEQLDSRSSQSLYSLPRSRNNSQMNLTLLVTRQTSSSRAGSSGQQTPTTPYHHHHHDGD
ncbi:nucleoside phosphatase GDA1 [Pyrrhoderma noxium]|uniref:Nucleoside phosphatase GDA1 n=1 Tax=Pyrrhoderma noxium TaxID=2282107 RepID=A0A286UW08_9AGAM|nr:nucleoside phosphatase GDA1 [Pyrrhoderma noxium]